ncbi:hypothetical protein B0H17DRAFT_8564 [Mycena rosella]|uniref:Uncharacterized protein n=1 Tax=Mycena rosella TaxID=1033263 RepID=A0AAD7M778_MYCRO|nr:hypothetical protein B0H17DRAFT_8564 [Mycena rosella]
MYIPLTIGARRVGLEPPDRGTLAPAGAAHRDLERRLPTRPTLSTLASPGPAPSTNPAAPTRTPPARAAPRTPHAASICVCPPPAQQSAKRGAQHAGRIAGARGPTRPVARCCYGAATEPAYPATPDPQAEARRRRCGLPSTLRPPCRSLAGRTSIARSTLDVGQRNRYAGRRPMFKLLHLKFKTFKI